MKQNKWRFLAGMLVLILCLQLFDQNMFLHVQAVGSDIKAGNAVNSESPANGEDPGISESPAVTQEPVVSEEPVTTQEPTGSVEPEITEEPVQSETPGVTEEPNPSKEPVKISLTFPYGKYYDIFMLEYKDIKDFNTYEDKDGKYEPSNIAFDITDKEGKKLDEVNTVQYNSVSTSQWKNDIWKSMCEDFNSDEIKEDKDNWTVVCFTFFDEESSSLEVYPMFVHCRLSSYDDNYSSYVLKTDDWVRKLDNTYDVNIVLGTQMQGLMGEQEAEDFAFTSESEYKLSVKVKDEKIGIHLNVKNGDFEVNTSYDGIMTDTEDGSFIRSHAEGSKVILRVNLKGKADIMRAFAKKVLKDNSINTDGDAKFTDALVLWNGKNLLEQLSSDNKEQIRNMINRNEENRSLQLSFPIEDGEYKEEECKYSFSLEDDGREKQEEKSIVTNHRLVVDSAKPVLTMGKWQWKKDGETVYFENEAEVQDLSVKKADVELYWYVNGDRIYISDERPDLDKHAVSFMAIYNVEKSTLRVRLDAAPEQYPDLQLEGKKVSLSIRDQAGNTGSIENNTIRIEQLQYDVNLDEKAVQLNQTYYVADTKRNVNGVEQEAEVTRYQTNKSGNEIQFEEAANSNFFIQEKKEGEHAITLTAYYLGLDESKSYFQMVRTDGTKSKTTKVYFKDASRNEGAMDGRNSYTNNFQFETYGEYKFSMHVEADGKVIDESDSKFITVLYDMSSPVTDLDSEEITTKEKASIWNLFGLFAKEKKEIIYTVTVKETDTPIVAFGVTQEGKWLKPDSIVKNSTYECSYTIKIDNKMKGKIKFYAFNKFGLLNDPEYTIIEDNTAPVVHFSHKADQEDVFTECSEKVKADSKDTVKVFIEEEYFNEAAVYVLTEEQWKACKSADDYARYQSAKVSFAWNKDSENQKMHWMDIALAPYYQNGGDEYRVICVTGKDYAGNQIEGVNALVLDTDVTAPELHYKKISLITEKVIKEDRITINEKDQIAAEVTDVNFDVSESAAYLLTEEEYGQYAEGICGLDQFESEKLTGSWSGKNPYQMMIDVSTMENKETRVLLTVAKDRSGNETASENVLRIKKDCSAPEMKLNSVPDQVVKDYTYKGTLSNNRKSFEKKIGKLDVYQTDDSGNIKFTFELEDDNLIELKEDELHNSTYCGDVYQYVMEQLFSRISVQADMVQLTQIYRNSCTYEYKVKSRLENPFNESVFDLNLVDYQLGTDGTKHTASDPAFTVEDNAVVTHCTVEVTLEEGYYENFAFSVLDEAGNSNVDKSYYVANYNIESSSKNSAFCIFKKQANTEASIDVVSKAEHSVQYADETVPCMAGREFRMNVSIPDQNVNWAAVKVITKKKDNQVTDSEEQNIFSFMKVQAAPGKMKWKLTEDIVLSGNNYYELELHYGDFAGNNRTVKQVMITDNKKPTVQNQYVKADTKGDYKTAQYKEESCQIAGTEYKFAIGNTGLKQKISIEDLHLSEENAKNCNVQIYKLPDQMKEIQAEDYKEENWVDMDSCVNSNGEPLVQTVSETYESGLPEGKTHETEQTLENTAFHKIISFTEDGRYLVRVQCSDDVGNEFETAPQGIVIDSAAPSKASIICENVQELKNKKDYNTGDQKTAVDVAKEHKTDYIATKDVTLKLMANDTLSDEFEVKAYLLSSDQEYKFDKVKDAIEMKQDAKDSYYTAKINKSFRGVILYSITDKAQNTSYVAEGNVVIDLVKAQVSYVSVPKTGKGDDGKYYTSREFTITVVDNFWKKGSLTLSDKSGIKELEPEKTADLETANVPTSSESGAKTEECKKYTFKVDYSKKVAVKDGEYGFDILYDEYAGVHPKITIAPFIMDRTAPEYSNKYKDIPVYNGKYYKSAQSAVLSLKELNPVTSEALASITRNGEETGVCALDSKYFKGVKVYTSSKADSTADKHVFHIPFAEDGYYQMKASTTDMAGNSSVKNVDDSFVIDTKAPSVKVVNVSKKNQGTLEKVFHYLSFGFFYHSAIEVQVEAVDETSGVQKLIYYTVDEKKGTSKETVVKGTKIPYKSIGQEGASEQYKLVTKIELSPDFKGKVYVKAADFAENESNGGKFKECTSAVLKKQSSSDSFIRIKSLSEPNENGFYNKDFKVQLLAHENYDGLHYVDYSAGSLVDGKVDFSEKTKDDTKLTYQWTKTVKIDAKANDDNKVKVLVSYQDNAGNKIVKKEETYKVDVTKPVLSVTYDNQSAQRDTYYKENRTATIRIDELNFKSEDVSIKVTRNGREVSNIKPGKSAWSTRGITHTAHVTFSEDGDYEFSVEYTDLADNKADYVHHDKFTVDKTKPEAAIAYDNNRAQGKQYYSKARTATITVNEHNFDASAVKVNISRKDKSGAGVPRLSGWSSNGDRHTATVAFQSDGVYGIQVSSSDIAGNASEDLKEETFTIDQTKPELKITGVKKATAYSGRVVPVLTYTDTNLKPEAVSVTVEGYKNGKVNVKYKENNTKNGKIRSLDMFPQKKSVDDVYTMTVKVADKAGNSSSKKVFFSVNRFGSNYSVDDEVTATVLNSYIKDEKDIVIEEVNVRNLKNYAVTCSMDGNIATLEEGNDYQVEVANSEHNWKKYTYTVFAKNFTKEGNYSICISSTDEAGNVSNNEEKKQDLRFTIDKTAPTLTTAGIENNRIYNAATGNLDMIVSDNIIVDQVRFYLNDKELQRWEQKDIEGGFGELKADIPGSDSRQNIKIALRDVAGNENQYDISNFLITQNKWIQYYNNKKAVVATVGGAGVLLAAVCLVLLRRNRKKTA